MPESMAGAAVSISALAEAGVEFLYHAIRFGSFLKNVVPGATGCLRGGKPE
jgi:hypothetical protein